MSASRRTARATPTSRAGRLAGAATLLSVSFVLSRILGLLRNSVIAAMFGNSRPVEAYFAAFRIPDTMFLLVSGGALASAFIPVFVGLSERDEEEAWKVANTVFSGVFIVLAAMAAIAFLLAPEIMGVLVPHYTTSERALTIDLTRIMLLQPIFLGVQAIAGSILQSYHRFLLTAVAPLVYNLAVVVGALLFGPRYGVAALAWSVTAGAALMLAIQLPGLPRAVRPSANWSLPATREILRLMAPRVVGYAAFQAMLLITLYLAQGLPQGMVAAINYSWVLIYFPVGALGTAAATAVFPTLSRLTSNDDLAALRLTVSRSLRLLIFLALPSAIGLIVLRRPIINLLYGHGVKWTPAATEQTAFALIFYALALAPLTILEMLPRVFYAMKDTITPVKVAIVAVAIDAVLSVVLVHLLPADIGQGGLALATAVATTIQAVWLARKLETRLGDIGNSGLLLTLRDATIASAVMGLVLYLALDPLTALIPDRGFGALVITAAGIALGGAIFTATAYLLGAPELEQTRSFLMRRS